MVRVKQRRVLRNVLCVCGLCALVVWLLRTQLWAYRDALGLGLAAGVIYGAVHWWQLSRKITRRDRRYERNKIFVHYLSSIEALLTSVIHNPYVAIPLGLVLLLGVFVTVSSAHWWTVLLSSFGLTATAVLSGCIVRYERRHGPLHYQYNAAAWSGAEGLLYQVGTVTAPLQPAGKVTVQGVLWNAVSLSGETINNGEQVEVLSVERLTLYVDRLPHGERLEDARRLQG